MIRAARLQKIRTRLGRDGSVSISELAKRFRKNPITLRRDLLILENEGVLKRTHGGAVALAGNEPAPYEERAVESAVEKSAIAKKAAEYVNDSESIIINAGTTMQAFAMHLRHRRDLQVVTNGVTLVAELAHSPAAHVLLIGGETDFKKLGTVGPLAEEMIQKVHVSKAFLGVSGISLDHGLLMHSPAEARINACFLRAADEVTVIVDSSKFEANFIYRVAPLGDVHRLITDAKIKADARRCLAQAGVELVIAEDL